jgi:hypothetical protein
MFSEIRYKENLRYFETLFKVRLTEAYHLLNSEWEKEDVLGVYGKL